MLEKVQATLLSIYADTIVATPVRDGFLANNWNTNIGSVNTGTRGADKNGGASTAQADQGVSNLKIGDTIFFSNNLPYAVPVEFGVAGQNREPRRMLERSIRNHV